MDQTFMKEKPILPLLLSMAAPMILSMLVNSLYNIIDSIFVAQISEDAMTALSLVFPIQNFVNSVAGRFRYRNQCYDCFLSRCRRPAPCAQSCFTGILPLHYSRNPFKYHRHPHYAFIFKTIYSQ